MPKAAVSSITPCSELCALLPLADRAEFGGYNFGNRSYTIELRKDGRYVDKIEVDRDEAVKLALQIIGVQTLVSNNLTSEEREVCESIAAAR